MKPRLQGVQPVLGATNLAVSVRFFARLGFQLMFQDQPANPRYAAVRRDAVELHLQSMAADQLPASGDRPVYRFPVDDVDALYAEFRASGGLDPGSRSPWAAPGNTPWGTREFHLHDPDRNGLQFYRPI